MSANKRLVRTYNTYDTNTLTDLLSMVMANIEDALLETGAEPTTDYNRMDLLREATPFVLSMFSENRDPVMLNCTWHDPEGNANG